MAEWKSYRVENDKLEWYMQVELRQDPETHKRCREMLEFFHKSKKLIEEFGGDVYKAFAVFLATWVFPDSAGAIDAVLEKLSKEEGFYPLTKENGIEISSMDSFEVCYEDFNVHEVDT